MFSLEFYLSGHPEVSDGWLKWDRLELTVWGGGAVTIFGPAGGHREGTDDWCPGGPEAATEEW